MIENFASYFNTNGFMPHGHCFFWTPSLLWIYVVSDFTIAASYLSIPFALWYFVQKRPDVPFRWIFVMFGAFVLACGTTHLFSLWNIWHADYWADAAVKALAASVSVATAILLWPLIPKALMIPSTVQLKEMNLRLQNEVMRRAQAENGLLLANETLERRVAERAVELETTSGSLRESEARFRATFEQAAVGIAHIARNGRWVRVNQKLCDVVGYTREELLARTFEDITHPDDLDRDREQVARLVAKKISSYNVEKRYLHKNGGIVWINITVALVRKDSGKPDYFISVIEDISARRKAEAELLDSEERFRGLVEQSITGIYIIQDEKYAYANPRMAEIAGYASAEELIGRDYLWLVAEQDRSLVTLNMQERIEGKVLSNAYEFSIQRKDGSLIEAGVHSTRATYQGRPAILGLIQDISEKKRSEDEIKRYVAQLETAFMRTVGVATTLGEMRDPYTAGHQRKVAEIAVAIGAELGFDAHRQEGLRVAGYLHDIGKITIPAEILSKPGKLSPIEFQLIQAHSQAGYEVLKNVEFPWPVAAVALQHHERLDGSGYPQGLEGEAILLEARILAVADVMEAMSSHRPYRAGLGIDKTLAEIERGRGRTYDPAVADACLKLFREKGYAIPA